MAFGAGVVFGREAQRWAQLGQLQNSNCRGVREALQAGTFAVKPPRFQKIEVADNRLRVGGACAPFVPAASGTPR